MLISVCFKEDASYGLLCSLEVLNEDKTLKRKADIFDKQTIRPKQRKFNSVEKSPMKALTVKHGGKKDVLILKYMSDLSKTV